MKRQLGADRKYGSRKLHEIDTFPAEDFFIKVDKHCKKGVGFKLMGIKITVAVSNRLRVCILEVQTYNTLLRYEKAADLPTLYGAYPLFLYSLIKYKMLFL